jgi:hypothetical protein
MGSNPILSATVRAAVAQVPTDSSLTRFQAVESGGDFACRGTRLGG